ncbi:expressed unknown protein [Seminavis robusta]|uniref:PDZ domain-containing protein n=1 Tax=Seminavis robusta TaxID=568900 RepID=A0A9N8DMS0_9STRA|nr:expressed unknown protein [Seminavis robusta]|eukprot:Sro246_g097860.1 n/a (336) ;mRNA; r:69439-70446
MPQGGSQTDSIASSESSVFPPSATVEAIECDDDDIESGNSDPIPTIDLSSCAEACDVVSDADSVHVDNEDEEGHATAVTVDTTAVISMDGRMPAESEDEKRAGFISATIIIASIDTELGLSFRSLPEENGFYISQIKKTGLVFKSGAPFQVGDKVISINNKSCGAQMDHKYAAKMLRESSGFVTIVAQNNNTKKGDSCKVESMITKPYPNARAGIGFSSSDNPSKIYVCSVFFDGLFANSLLAVGDQVLSINGIPCRDLDPTAAADIIKSSPKYVTISARKFQGNGVVVASSSNSDTAKRIRFCGSRTTRRLCRWLCSVVFLAAFVTLILFVKAN